MAYDTKALLSSLANNVAKSETIKEAYWAIMEVANAEGIDLPSYEEKKEQIKELRREAKDV